MSSLELTNSVQDQSNLLFQLENSGIQSKTPTIRVRRDTLGGEARASLMLVIGFDPKETWVNNIFENSRYARFHLHHDGKLEMFVRSGVAKFRACRVKNVEHAAQKLVAWIKIADTVQA